MYRHGPSSLQGPTSWSRPWWLNADADAELAVLLGEAATPGMRLDLIARIRSEIAAGVYDTPEKWELALERLLDHVEGEQA
jgi:hypothetical protein